MQDLMQMCRELEDEEAAHLAAEGRAWRALGRLVIVCLVIYVVLQLGRCWGRTEALEPATGPRVLWEDRHA